jgi:hypothetical protein
MIGGGLAAAGSVAGAVMSSNASKSAASTQANSAAAASQAQLQAAEESIAAQQQSSEAAQANQQPWINAGSAALTQLGNLLGIQIAPSGQYAAAATSQGGGGTGGAGTGGGPNLVDTSSGIPAPNQQLYQNNPAYKAAWDKVAKMNQDRFGTGYRADSNPTMLAQELQDTMGPQGMASLNPATTAGNGQFQPGTVYGGPTGGFAGTNGQTSPLQALENTPGYQFSLQQGLQGVENSAAARGMQLSGATLKDLNNYAQGTAQQTYQTQVSDAMQMAGLGSGAAGTASGNTVATGANIGSTITGAGNQVGSNMIGAGNAQAAGQVGSANAYTGAFNNISQMYTMNSLFGGGAGGGGGSSMVFPSNTFSMPS